MAEPRFSVCTTNYNCGHALRAHLTSIYGLFNEGDFEYFCVDNFSRDASAAVLNEWQSRHRNFRWVRRRCSMGAGREVAVQMSVAPHLLVVDTDTVYFPVLQKFVDRVLEELPDVAVQAIYAGVFPRDLWNRAGGRRNINVGEDFDMWMRIWRSGRMRWYPLPMGENIKEPYSRDASDFLSGRYTKDERLARFLRRQVDLLKLSPYRGLDLEKIWRSNTVDLQLGETRDSWFSSQPQEGVISWFRSSASSLLRILQS